MRINIGYTLLESLIVLMIIGITILMTIPSFKKFLLIHQGRQAIISLELTVRSARTQAIFLGRTIIMCPSNDDKRCNKNWNDPIIMFVDLNNNNQLDANEPIIKYLRAAKDNEHRYFSGTIIRFNANGFSGFNTGSLSYCSDHQATVNGVIIISRLGRIRRGFDQNGDGIKELANGKNLPCADKKN